jgi:hypothetical protein
VSVETATFATGNEIIPSEDSSTSLSGERRLNSPSAQNDVESGAIMIHRALASFFITLIAVSGIWPETAATATIPEAVPDKGLVVFYRPKKTAGSVIRFSVDYAGGSMGTLGNGTMLYRYFEPGQHQFWSQVIAQDALSLSVEAGRVYFVAAAVRMGIYAGRPKFTVVDDATGRSAVAKL